MASTEPYPAQGAAPGQGPSGTPSAAEAASRPAFAAEAVKKEDTKRRSADQYLSLFFRLLQISAAVISFVVILVSGALDLNWRSYQVFKYVLSATVIAAGWATLMLLIEIVQLIIGRKLRSTIWRAIVCVGDWLMAILTFSAGCAGAAVTTFNDRGGVPNFAPCHGPTPYGNFCTRTKVSVAFAFITFGFFIPHLVLSTLSYLIRRYEG